MIAPVMAETLTGTLGGSITDFTDFPTLDTGAAYAGGDGSVIYVRGSEYANVIESIVFTPKELPIFYAAAPKSGNTAQFVGHIDDPNGSVVVSGTIGYMRYYNFLGVEQIGYIWYSFNNWDISNLSTGDHIVYLMNYNFTAFGIQSFGTGYSSGPDLWPDGMIAIVPAGYPYTGGSTTHYTAGVYKRMATETIYSSYTFEKPSGLGITGTINKTYSGTVYPSKLYVYNATSDGIITSDYTITTTDLYVNTPVPMIKVSMISALGTVYNSTNLFSLPGPGPTPTSTPIPTGDYYLSITSPYVNVGGTITATISSPSDPGLSNLIGIQYYATDPVNPSGVYFYEAASLPTSYWKYGANWVGYSDLNSSYTNTKSGIPNPIGLVCNVQGNKTLTLVVTKSNNQTQILTYPIYVGLGSNYLTTRIQSIEGMGGGILTWTTINVYNKNLHTWQNSTTYTGAVEISAAPGTLFDVYGTKSGYVNAQLLNIPAREDITYQLPFFTGVTPSAGNQSMAIRTVNADGVAISGVLIQVTEAGTATTYVKTSNTGGAATFTLKQSTLYTVHVTKTGWRASDDSFTTTTASSDSWVVMMYPGAAPTATIPRTTAPVPTGSWTVSPSVTPFGNGTTFWQPWVNVFSQMGASSYELPLLIAALVIFLCMIIGAAAAGVLGAEVGMGFGAILSVALGLIPIWVVIAIIVLGFLFYGLKVTR